MVFPKRLQRIFNAAASLTKRGVPVPPLSYEQALAFFDRLANRDDLAMGYPHEACFARTHFICEAALNAGFMPEKAWAIDERHGLRFAMPDGETVHYRYHAAMALPVRTPGGEIHRLVFDPALFDGPVSLQEWGRAINAEPHQLQIVRLGVPPAPYRGDYDTVLRTTRALSDPNHERHPLRTIRHYQHFEIIPRTVFVSPYCRDHIFPALDAWPERRGRGWVSVDPLPKAPLRPATPAAQSAPADEPKTGG